IGRRVEADRSPQGYNAYVEDASLTGVLGDGVNRRLRGGTRNQTRTIVVWAGRPRVTLPASPMSNDDDDLPFGLYERLVTAGLKARLLRFDSATTRIVTEELDATEAHATLARHIANL